VALVIPLSNNCILLEYAFDKPRTRHVNTHLSKILISVDSLKLHLIKQHEILLHPAV